MVQLLYLQIIVQCYTLIYMKNIASSHQGTPSVHLQMTSFDPLYQGTTLQHAKRLQEKKLIEKLSKSVPFWVQIALPLQLHGHTL